MGFERGEGAGVGWGVNEKVRGGDGILHGYSIYRDKREKRDGLHRRGAGGIVVSTQLDIIDVLIASYTETARHPHLTDGGMRKTGKLG